MSRNAAKLEALHAMKKKLIQAQIRQQKLLFGKMDKMKNEMTPQQKLILMEKIKKLSTQVCYV